MSQSEEGIEIVSVSLPFEYFVPRFSCVSFMIRQITFRAELYGTVHTYDGFIRDDSSLHLHKYPAVVYGYLYFVGCRWANFANLPQHTT